MDTKVTKVKNEGRVQAGKRLVEWNRKNKENLKKGSSHAQEPSQEPRSSHAQEPTNPYFIIVGIIVAGGAVWYFSNRPASAPPKPRVVRQTAPAPAPQVYDLSNF